MEKTYKAIIIDDNAKARLLLTGMLKEYASDIEIVADAADLVAGVKAIKKHKPNLIFLDIEMPQHSGLEILDFFDDQIDFEIIFITAYNEYAIQAFKLSAIDYILKPIEIEDLEKSMERFRRNQDKNNLDYKVLKENLAINLSEKIAVPISNGIKFIEIKDIMYLKADRSYTEIFVKNASPLTVSRSLKNFEDVLISNNNFVRCHKSYIINTLYVTDYIKSDGGYVLMGEEIKIPISLEKSDDLMAVMKVITRK